MFRLAVFFSLALLLCILPGGYAGPACTRKYYKTAQCVQKCQTRWGYPGTMMGTNRWGVVMQHVDDDSKDGWKAVIAEACGMASSKSKEVEEDDSDNEDDDDPGVAGAVGSNPDDTSDDDDDDVSTVFATTSLSTSSSVSSTSSSSTSTSKSLKTPPPTRAGLQATPPPKKPTTSPTQEKETPAPKPTPKPTPEPDNSGDDDEDDDDDSDSSDQGGDIGEYLKGHNNFRKLHGATALTWNDNLASKAQQWANKCQFKHSGGSLGPFGENLAAGTGSSYGIANAIKSWTDESTDYDPNNPEASHFTQVVWKNSKRVGCALQMCDGIFDPKFGKAKFVVCEYDPPGNFNNDFAANVQV